VPLDTPLDAARHDDGSVTLQNAGTLIADCPSYSPTLWGERPSLLARMHAEILEPIPLGRPVVAVGWTLGAQGRKHESATALLDSDGRMLARAAALWIQIR
jgi:hypothetical protein